MTISGGGELSGYSQGDGSHLDGLTITLNNNNWETVTINDSDPGYGDSDNSQTLNGTQNFDGSTYFGNPRVEAEYELLLEDPDGNTYRVLGFNINEPGVTSYATVEGLAFVGGVAGFPPIGVPLTVIEASEGPNVNYVELASPPCFTTGSLIDTPRGPRAVEDLRAGDWVLTQDNGPQQIRWVGVRRMPQAVLDQNPTFKPIKICAGAFGADAPARDMHLSPQHRVLVSGWQSELLFGEEEILVPAVKLLNDHSITIDHHSNGVAYYHFMCNRHEIVFADGLACESYLTGDGTDIVADTQREIQALFPALEKEFANACTARTCVSDKRATVLGAMLHDARAVWEIAR